MRHLLASLAILCDVIAQLQRAHQLGYVPRIERGSGEISIKVVDDSDKNYLVFFTYFLISAAKVQ